MLAEAGVRDYLLEIVTLAAERVRSIHDQIRVGEQIVHQSAGHGGNAEFVAALQNVAEPRSVRPVGASAAEFAIVVAVVAICAQDAHANGAGRVHAIEVQHLAAQAGLSESAFPIVHDRMTGGRRPAKFGDHIQWVTRADKADRQISIFRRICDLAGTAAMTTQTVLVLVQRRIERCNAIGSADANHPAL